MAYIGSSKNFKNRMKCHKSNCYNENQKAYNYFIYQYIRQHGGWDAFTKEIIHTCEVADDTEQRKVEQEWIKNNECKLNIYKSYETEEERKERKKQYRQANIERFKERGKQKITCECGSVFRNRDTTHHKRTKKHIQFMEAK